MQQQPTKAPLPNCTDQLSQTSHNGFIPSVLFRLEAMGMASERADQGELSYDEFKKMDARVGTITLVERIPRTEKLFKIMVDLGPLGIRQTCSSLVGFYEADTLLGKRVVFLYNLKPTKFAGEVSQGMLLAAEQDNILTLLTIDREVPNGARIT